MTMERVQKTKVRHSPKLISFSDVLFLENIGVKEPAS